MFATFKHPLMRNLEVERYDDADSDLSDEDREPEPALCSRMVKSSLWQDVCESVYDSRYASAVALVVALYVGYIITISPYQSSHPYLSPEQRSLDTLVSAAAMRGGALQLTCASTIRNTLGRY